MFFWSRCILFSWIRFHSSSVNPKTKKKYPTLFVRYCQVAGFCFFLLVEYRKFWLPLYGYLLPSIEPIEAIHLHGSCARKVKEFCKRKGGLFVKLGQYASSLQNILPKEYLQELATLQDQAQEYPIQDLLQVLQTELGPFRGLLTDISETPIGCASIAQVHKANLIMSSTKVAIKIQKPNVQEQFADDLRMLQVVLSIYQTLKGGYEPIIWNIFVEFIKEIQQEMDFVKEMANNRKLARCFQENYHIQVPRIFPRLCSRRVFTMEYIDGMNMDDCISLDKQTRYRIVQTLHEAFARMLFEGRFLHMDPHPGNIILQYPTDSQRFRMVFIDTGKCSSVDPAFIEKFANLILAIVLRDTQRLASLFPDTSYDGGELFASFFLGKKMARTWLNHSELVGRKHSIHDYLHIISSVHPQFVTVMRPFLVIRGISRKLGYPKDATNIYAPFAMQLAWKTWLRRLHQNSMEALNDRRGYETGINYSSDDSSEKSTPIATNALARW